MEGTAAILPSQVLPHMRKHLGIFIDIFPYDAVPDDKEEELSQIKQRAVLYDELRLVERGWDPIHPISTLKYVLERPRFKSLYAQYEDLFRRHKIEDNRCVSCYSYQVNPEQFLRDKEWYSETVYLPFEDVMMPLPKEYDKILRLQYGDYMTPVKAPSYHGRFWALTADRPYQECSRERRKDIIHDRVQGYLNRIKKLLRRFGCIRKSNA